MPPFYVDVTIGEKRTFQMVEINVVTNYKLAVWYGLLNYYYGFAIKSIV